MTTITPWLADIPFGQFFPVSHPPSGDEKYSCRQRRGRVRKNKSRKSRRFHFTLPEKARPINRLEVVCCVNLISAAPRRPLFARILRLHQVHLLTARLAA